MFRRSGLFLNDLERLSIHGGSLRLYVNRHENVQEPVRRMRDEEERLSVNRHEYFRDFGVRVEGIRTAMRELLTQLKADGRRIAAYGAAAKGTIMLNYIGVEPGMIDFVVDRNVHKHGKYMPGVRIPICEPSRLMEAMPDYVVLLPWNFREEILAQQTPYRNQGGKFIVPIPEPTVV